MLRIILLSLCIAMTAISFGQSPQSATPAGKAVDPGSPLEKDGTLGVLVTWGDIDNTPADDVYVDAYEFVRKYKAFQDFRLSST